MVTALEAVLGEFSYIQSFAISLSFDTFFVD